MTFKRFLIRLSLQFFSVIFSPLIGFFTSARDPLHQIGNLSTDPAWLLPMRFYGMAFQNGSHVFLITVGSQIGGLLMVVAINATFRWANRSKATPVSVFPEAAANWHTGQMPVPPLSERPQQNRASFKPPAPPVFTPQESRPDPSESEPYAHGLSLEERTPEIRRREREIEEELERVRLERKRQNLELERDDGFGLGR